MIRWALFSLLAASLVGSARADVAGALNSVRLHGCQGVPRSVPLSVNPRLDEAARRLSRGTDLHTAVERSGYRARNSTAVRITNVPTDGDIERIVARQFCRQVTQPDLRDIGTYRRGPDIWLVIAQPFITPRQSDSGQVSRRVLQLTNEARSHARRCGSELFQAAAPLTLDGTLALAAIQHTNEMAAHDYLDHIGRDGSSPADRVTRTGYSWSSVGENLASGTMNADETVNGWIGSPHHCANLMSPKFTHMAVAFAVNAASRGGIYWTQVFATPRQVRSHGKRERPVTAAP